MTNLKIVEVNDKSMLQTKGVSLQELIAALSIESADDMKTAVEYGGAIKALIKEIEAFHNPNIKKADQLHTDLIAQRNVMLVPCQQGKKILQHKATTYNNDMEAIREAEQVKEQALAEQKAVKEQKRTDTKIGKLLGGVIDLEEQKKSLQEALMASVSAIESQTIEVRITQLQRQIDTKQDKAEDLQTDNLMPIAIPIYQAPEKMAGVKTITERVVTNIDMAKLVNAVAMNHNLLHLLKVNDAELKRLIKANVPIDGVTIETRSVTKV